MADTFRKGVEASCGENKAANTGMIDAKIAIIPASPVASRLVGRALTEDPLADKS
jgi:hypothetical protein